MKEAKGKWEEHMLWGWGNAYFILEFRAEDFRLFIAVI